MWVIGYAKATKEFEVQDALRDMGIAACVPRKVEAKRVPTKRRPVPVTTPYLRNYVFIECSAEQWHDLAGVKHLAKTTVFVSKGEVKLLRAFIDTTEAEYLDRMGAIEAGQRVEEYSPGDMIEITGGPLAGQLARFRRIVESAHDLFPRLRAEGELFGQSVTVDVDPIHARKAG